jgi:hypothetical protein
VPTLTVHLRHLPPLGTPAASHLTIPTMHRQRYPTAYPPSLPTKLVHPRRIIARVGHQRLRTHLRRRLGQQRASCPFVITRPPAYLHTARQQTPTQNQQRNLDIALPPLTAARLVVGTAGGGFPTGGIHSHCFRGRSHPFQQLANQRSIPSGCTARCENFCNVEWSGTRCSFHACRRPSDRANSSTMPR